MTAYWWVALQQLLRHCRRAGEAQLCTVSLQPLPLPHRDSLSMPGNEAARN